MTHQNSINERGVISCDPKSGRIERAHFTRRNRPQSGEDDPAETQLRRLLGSEEANLKLLHVGPNELQRGQRYRVQPATGKFILARTDEAGFSAAAGSSRPVTS